MGWEKVINRGGGFTGTPLGLDEVNVLRSKNKNRWTWRINMSRKNFPEDTRSVKVMVDKEKKRIGFFRVSESEIWEAKKLSHYKKGASVCYISMPRVMEEMGWKVGHYKIVKIKGRPEDMFFYIALDKPKDGTVVEETKEEAKAS